MQSGITVKLSANEKGARGALYQTIVLAPDLVPHKDQDIYFPLSDEGSALAQWLIRNCHPAFLAGLAQGLAEWQKEQE